MIAIYSVHCAVTQSVLRVLDYIGEENIRREEYVVLHVGSSYENTDTVRLCRLFLPLILQVGLQGFIQLFQETPIPFV